MNVSVRLFAVARQLADDRPALSLEVPTGCTIARLREQLAAEIPSLAPLLPHVLFAVGSEYVGDDHVIAAGDALACIPPVSGG